MRTVREVAQKKFRFPLAESKATSARHLITPAPSIDRVFPSETANILAEQESFNKHLFRPNTYLHKWWARRSGSTFRFILKHLSDEPSKQDYYSVGGLEGKVILDPMMGGGTIAHEAIRLGANVVGFDLDPIPVLQARASLTQIPLSEKIAVFKQFYQKLSATLSPYFLASCPTCQEDGETQFVLYGLRKRCHCGEALFVDSFRLREQPHGEAIRLCPETGVPYSDRQYPSHPLKAKRRILEKGTRKCTVCNEPFQEFYGEQFVRRYVPFVVVGKCSRHGMFFKSPSQGDLKRFQKAERAVPDDSLPKTWLEIPPGPKSDDLLNRKIKSFSDLFTARQLLYITTCKELLDTVDSRHHLWLGLLISTSLEFNSLLCGFKGSDKRRPGAIRHVFSHHAYSFPHTALENNPVFSGNTSGTLGLLFRDRIQAANLWAEEPVERMLKGGTWKKIALLGETDGGTPVDSFSELRLKNERAFLVAQRDSSHLPLPDDSIDHVVTDPPYFDSVQYSDLAHFFRVWLQWLLPEEADWNYRSEQSAVAESQNDGERYQRILSAIWSECRRVLKKPTGRLIFTFHHWRAEAWARLSLSLKKAGFRLLTSYAVHSENPISVHIRQLKALTHDSILVLSSVILDHTHAKPLPFKQIRTDNSLSFCLDCAKLLGFCLESNLSETEIIQLWREALRA